MSFEINREAVEAAMAKAPALRPLLTRLARKAAKGMMLPVTFSEKGLDYEAQCMLEGIMKLPTNRTADGAVRGILLPDHRKPAAWEKVFDLLLAAEELAPKSESVDVYFEKLQWRFPEQDTFLLTLKSTPEVSRYLTNVENREKWLRLFQGVSEFVDDEVREPSTLSQLGSQWLNDSKALRTGSLRRQLYWMLSIASGRVLDERKTFGMYGISENPYTSCVTVYAPFAFTTDDGRTYDFPHKLFKSGMAAVLPSETVNRIRRIEWFGQSKTLVTSENAAPFARYVAKGSPCLYTEGYPNFAVQRLLGEFAKAKVSVDHAGDADLHGLLIVQMLEEIIPVTRVRAVEIVENPGDVQGIPLTDEQHIYLKDHVHYFPDMAYISTLRKLLERGCWYEQEAFPL